MGHALKKAERCTSFIPVNVEVEETGTQLHNVTIASLTAGDIGFRAPHPIFIGTIVTLTFNDAWPDYIIRGEVAWCRARGGQYEVGVHFEHGEEAFRARMLAQFGQIERYRANLHKREGRDLSLDEAALEWVDLYAETFAQNVGW